MGESIARRVALTIDAEHPDGSRSAPGNCRRILETLERARVRATFFLQGRWVTAHPDLAREVARQGHLIGNHSHYHARMPLLTEAGQVADVTLAERVIRSVVGTDPRPWFRSPFGAGLDDPALTQTLAQLGYRNVPWDVDGKDWQEDRSAQQVEDALVAGITSAGPDQIALLHSWPDQAAEALPGILSRWQEAGVELLTMDQIFGGT